METMKAIYKILETLEKSLDDENFNFELVKHTSIGISEYKWSRLIGILQYEEFIDGFRDMKIDGAPFPQYREINPTITFKGIIYLAENTNTAKIINAAKLLKDVIPGL